MLDRSLNRSRYNPVEKWDFGPAEIGARAGHNAAEASIVLGGRAGLQSRRNPADKNPRALTLVFDSPQLIGVRTKQEEQ